MINLNSLSLKNFGSINEAKINLSPLTVFVGKNSSGKSFISSLIHCLSNPFNNSYVIHSSSLNYLVENNNKLFDDFKFNLNQFLKLNPKFEDEFKYSLDNFTTLLSDGFGKCYQTLIEKSLKRNWKTNLNNLNRLKNIPFEITYNEINFINENSNLLATNFKDYLENQIKGLNSITTSGIKISFDENNIIINLDYDILNKIYNNKDTSFAKIIYILVVDMLIDNLKFNSFYIPVNSEILSDFNSYIVNEINDTVNSSNIQKEFITNLLNVNEGMQKGYFYELACELESEINHGEIQIKNKDLKEELVFVDEKYDLQFNLNLVSSSVRELIPLILYLKYYLNKDDVLIIEEIENHLHPENQVILVKYLVKAINQGLNIILTTHSDYIIEKFNNLIQLGNCKKEVFKHLNYDESCILDYNDISIYNFKKNGMYDYTPVAVDVNFTGFCDENFQQVINELYNESDVMDEYKIR